MRQIILAACAAVFLTTAAYADFSYTETTNLTGGSMKSAMKMASKMGGQSLDNQVTQVYLSGGRMAQVRDDSATVTNLDDETITEINFKKREYSVTTFAEMREALEAARADAEKQLAKAKKKNPEAADVRMTFNVDVEDPGRSETIDGRQAREMILAVTANFETEDAPQGAAMNIVTNMWLTEVPGAEEAKQFYARMGEKLGWSPDAQMFEGFQRGFGMGDSMAEMQEKMAQLEGFSVKQIMRLGQSAEGMQALAARDQEQVAAAQQQREEERPSMKDALKGLGGFGGFGRKKKEKQEPAPAARSGGMTAAEAGVLMEITSTQTGFSTAAIGEDKFRAPEGFKRVDSKLAKRIQ